MIFQGIGSYMVPWRRRLTFVAVSAVWALSACIGVAEDQPSGIARQPGNQVPIERVVQASFTTIASRYVDAPDFRKISVGALRGLNKLDSDIALTDRGDKLQLRRRTQVLGE